MPLYDGPPYAGTAAEQWALAGLDAATGRISAEELHALGTELFREIAEEHLVDRDTLKGCWAEADAMADAANEECDKLREKIRFLENRIRTPKEKP